VFALIFLLPESSTDASYLNDRLIAILDGPSPPDLESPSDKKKTNVRFNELVERIEVISDDDPDKNKAASVPEGNNGDVV
jgi:hypothetical protein